MLSRTPLIVAWPYWLVFWTVFVVTFAPEWRLLFRSRQKGPPSAQDAGSIRVILIGNSLAMWGAFAAAFVLPATGMPRRQAAFWTGIALLASGAALRQHCFRMLGGSFTGVVTVRPGQEIVERGAYRRVRHPSYSAAFLIFGGIGLALANWVSLLVPLATSVVVYGYRVRVEERALVGTLGEPYRAYMRRTRRFVPFVF
jgi:protein-S-isoprenylcysteine O-methyltransferase Ste14